MNPDSKIIKRLEFDPEFRPVSLGPIIKKKAMSAYDEAKQIISKARQEASRMTRQASQILKNAEQERQQEMQRGYEEGHEKGLGELTERMWEVEAEKEKFMNDAEPQVIRMVMDIAEKVIGREIEKGAVVDVVKKAISQAVGRKLIVRIHPADLAMVKEREKELMTVLEQNQTVSVREDEEIPAGGCIVESEKGAVDARLETQLAAIKKALGLIEEA